MNRLFQELSENYLGRDHMCSIIDSIIVKIACDKKPWLCDIMYQTQNILGITGFQNICVTMSLSQALLRVYTNLRSLWNNEIWKSEKYNGKSAPVLITNSKQLLSGAFNCYEIIRTHWFFIQNVHILGAMPVLLWLQTFEYRSCYN